MIDKLNAIAQSLLPQHLISRLIGWIAGTRFGPLKKLLIGLFVRLYRIDMQESEQTDPDSYPSFNALFTRALRPGARVIATDADAVISPVDGTVSQCGTISGDLLVQAKDRRFTVAQLLADSGQCAEVFSNGEFVTIYLAPHNYHRIHMPLDGRLRRMTFVPGRLFSVSPATTRAVNNLFARNERVVFHFDCDCGPVALVAVGALNVGSIETVHEGVVAPGGRQRRDWHYEKGLSFARGQEIARFNLGSTVILLLTHGTRLAPHAQADAKLSLGEIIARVQARG